MKSISILLLAIVVAVPPLGAKESVDSSSLEKNAESIVAALTEAAAAKDTELSRTILIQEFDDEGAPKEFSAALSTLRSLVRTRLVESPGFSVMEGPTAAKRANLTLAGNMSRALDGYMVFVRVIDNKTGLVLVSHKELLVAKNVLFFRSGGIFSRRETAAGRSLRLDARRKSLWAGAEATTHGDALGLQFLIAVRNESGKLELGAEVGFFSRDKFSSGGPPVGAFKTLIQDRNLDVIYYRFKGIYIHRAENLGIPKYFSTPLKLDYRLGGGLGVYHLRSAVTRVSTSLDLEVKESAIRTVPFLEAGVSKPVWIPGLELRLTGEYVFATARLLSAGISYGRFSARLGLSYQLGYF